MKIQARTRQPIPVDIVNSELSEGYLPRIDTANGLFIGEAIVRAHDRICHVYAINTTNEEIELELPPQEIYPYDVYEFTGEDSSIPEPDDSGPHPSATPFESTNASAVRAKRVMKALHISHLILEEKYITVGQRISRYFPFTWRITYLHQFSSTWNSYD